jgi:hypothetical protein
MLITREVKKLPRWINMSLLQPQALVKPYKSIQNRLIPLYF